jgi:hypothetical protein
MSTPEVSFAWFLRMLSVLICSFRDCDSEDRILLQFRRWPECALEIFEEESREDLSFGSEGRPEGALSFRMRATME